MVLYLSLFNINHGFCSGFGIRLCFGLDLGIGCSLSLDLISILSCFWYLVTHIYIIKHYFANYVITLTQKQTKPSLEFDFGMENNNIYSIESHIESE